MTSVKKVPAGMNLQYTIERAWITLEWLREMKQEQKEKIAIRDKKVAVLQERLRILADCISVYVSVLAENKGSGDSLKKSYGSHPFIALFNTAPIVKKCRMNRNNRSAHASKQYGHFVSPDEILSSNLEELLSDAMFFVCVVGKK